jgi:ATP-dependent RNA helicase DeaD
MLKKKIEQRQIPNGLEVCKKQLFHLIAKMQNVDVNEEQIAPYMDNIVKQLEYLTKEELLKHFVSLEFNRFLEYYKDAEDLNLYEKEQRTKNKEQRQEEGRGGRRERGRERNEGADYGRKKSGRKLRLKMNVGRSEGIEPRSFLKIINEVTRDKSINIGDIEITGNYTFFDVYQDQVDKVLRSFEPVADINVSLVKGNRQDDEGGGKGKGEYRSGGKERGRERNVRARTQDTRQKKPRR